MQRDEPIPEVARYQGGAFTRVQALEDGWSRGQIERRIASGRWRVLCGKALTADGDTSASALAWGAHLTWPDAVTSHTTAAQLHRFPVAADHRSHVTVPEKRTGLRGITVHTLALGPQDVQRHRVGPAVTGRVRTALDCLRYLPYEQAYTLLVWLLTRCVVTREVVEADLRTGPTRWGNAQVARLLRCTRGDAYSEAERLLHRLLRDAGITGWTANAAVHVARRLVARVDVLFEQHRVVLEIDGWAAHSGRQAFVTDRRRQNELQNAGYLVLRFTWDDLTQRPAEVLRHVRLALVSRG